MIESLGKVYRDALLRLSKKKMADFMYAVIITRAEIPNSYGVGIYEYNRQQNSYNHAQVKVFIKEQLIPEFERISGVKLEKSQIAGVNQKGGE